MAAAFLVLGAMKTGTTTVTAMCNADPRLHVLFEVDFSQGVDTNRNPEFIASLPEAEPLFGRPSSLAQSLADLEAAVPRFREQSFLYLGTKLPRIEPEYIRNNLDIPLITTARDVRTWICKNTIIQQFLGKSIDNDVVPLAINYATSMITAFLHPRALHLRMEEMVLDDGNRWPRQIAAFLGIDASNMEDWWEKHPQIDEASRFYSEWTNGHKSTFMQPIRLDTTSVLARHPFWDAYLPLFDKYYFAPRAEFSGAEIETDLKALHAVGQRMRMTIAEGFALFRSSRMGVAHASDASYLVDAQLISKDSFTRRR